MEIETRLVMTGVSVGVLVVILDMECIFLPCLVETGCFEWGYNVLLATH